MIRFQFLAPLVWASGLSMNLPAQSLLPTGLVVESLENPAGIDRPDPRLSWHTAAIDAAARDLRQTAYQIIVSSSAANLTEGKGDVWDSGKVPGAVNRHVHFAGSALVSSGEYHWAVRVWDQDDQVSVWSREANWTMGLLEADDWKAQWISAPVPEDQGWPKLEGEEWIWFAEKSGDPLQSAPKAKRYFRRTFEIPGGRTVRSAKISLLADNRSVLLVNGKQVLTGDLDEGAAVAEITQHLLPGKNLLALEVENIEESPAGWVGKCVIRLDDGSELVVASGAAWRSAETAGKGWDIPAFDENTWTESRELGKFGIHPWGSGREVSAPPAPAPYFRKTFDVSRSIKRATLHICGLGYHEVSLNGKKVGDHVLDPAFTRYDRRRLYVTHDVTAQLSEGKNAIGVILGNGWINVSAKAAWNFDEAAWRAAPMLRFQLVIEKQDGTVTTVVSDDSWKTGTGPVGINELLLGETYDARKEMEIAGWDRAGFDDTAWKTVRVVATQPGELSAQVMQPIRAVRVFKPVKLVTPRPGVTIFHFPQNIAGVARLKVRGEAGREITMVYGEKLNADGTLNNDNIKRHTRTPGFQTDRYILKGGKEETWQARFMYHGFQYVEVRGLPGTPSTENLEAIVEHTDLPTAGEFTSSNGLLNSIQHATRWSFVNNFHGYPTDCPHREKNGWTGDAGLAVETGLYNFGMDAGYTKWLRDLQDEQRPGGELPGIVPTAGWGYAWGNGPAWDSAYVLIPWAVYQMRGDREILATHYPNLKQYVDYLTKRSENGIVRFGLGDWLPAKTETPADVTSTAYYYKDALVLSQMAEVLGFAEDAKTYRKLSEEISASFQREFFKAGNASYANGSQTALSCALYQGLVPPEQKSAVAGNLAAAVQANNGLLDCGILGTKYLLHALTDNGHHATAYGVATQTGEPSWGHWMKQGATTLWENWDGSDSLNHIMFGDISAWFYQNLAGIKPEKPGFETIRIEPRMSAGLDWVKASHLSPQGPVGVRWTRVGNELSLEVDVPPNTTASVMVPATGKNVVREGQKPVSESIGVHEVKFSEGTAVISVGSGSYRFKSVIP